MDELIHYSVSERVCECVSAELEDLSVSLFFYNQYFLMFCLNKVFLCFEFCEAEVSFR